tara:strand:+ start:2227 stop:3081 length:855 start_codon:yes stop_codon:yes gene_type:complete
MSLEKQNFPKLKDLGEEVVEEVKDETQKVKDLGEEIVEEVKEGVATITKTLQSNPITDFFSKLATDNETSQEQDKSDIGDDDLDVEKIDDDISLADEDQTVDDQEISGDDEISGEDEDEIKPETTDQEEINKPMSAVIENTLGINDQSSEEDTDSDDEDYLQKFDADVKKNYLLDFHPEAQAHNYEEVKKFATVKRNKHGDIIDLLHRTIPILTKYEKTRVLGQRAKQLNSGAPSTVKIPDTTIDGYLMALEELRQRKIPFIIRRPIPNGGFEYWKVSDLEFLE